MTLSLFPYFKSHRPMNQKEIQIIKIKSFQSILEMFAHFSLRVKRIPTFTSYKEVFTLQCTIWLFYSLVNGLTNVLLVLIDVGTVKMTISRFDSGLYCIYENLVFFFLLFYKEIFSLRKRYNLFFKGIYTL